MTSKSLAAKRATGEGLNLAGLSDLAAMLDAPVASSAVPQMFDITTIREDDNTRTADNPGFSQESLQELANTILIDLDRGGRGIKSPLSLRPDPVQPGAYIINHGHRRYRAALIAGLSMVPGFIDEIFDKYDQVIENIQREALTAREIADFIGGELAKGHTQADIAKRLGRSKAFVSQHVKLLDLPETVAQAFHSGGIKDVTVANELARAHAEDSSAVEELIGQKKGHGLAAKSVITRGDVKSLRQKTSASPETNNRASQPEKKPVVGQARTKPCLHTLAASVTERLGVPVTLMKESGATVRMVLEFENDAKIADAFKTLGLADLFPQDV